MLDADNSASGSEITTASAVPAIDIASVSASGFSQLCQRPKSGGTISRSSCAKAGPAFDQALGVEEAGRPTARRRRRATIAARQAAGFLAARRSSARIAVVTRGDRRSSSQFRQVEIENLRGLAQDVVGFVVGRCEALRAEGLQDFGVLQLRGMPLRIAALSWGARLPCITNG